MQKIASNKEKKDLLKEYISFVPTSYNFENETAKKVFAVLHFYSHLNNHQPFTIGMRTIADNAMISTMTVSRAMKLLIEKYKYVECQKGHLKVNSTYQILSPSTETSIVTSTETLNKNDMLQRDQMLQQNVTTKLIDDVTITYTDNEQVTEIGNEQMLQCVTEGSQKGEMLHNNNNNNNNNNKHKHNNNFKNNNYIKNNKHMRKNTKKENTKIYALLSLLTSKIEVMSENQGKTTQVLEQLLLNSTPTVESEELKTLSDKVLQLEETVNKQTEKIEYLNLCLDKARNAYKNLKEEIAKSNSINAYTPTEVGNTQIENKQSICLSVTPSPSMVEREQTNNKYKQLISAFYNSKKSKHFTEASKYLNELKSLIECANLNSHQVEQIENAKKYLEEDLHKTSTHALDSQPWETEEYRAYCEGTKQLFNKASALETIKTEAEASICNELLKRADGILSIAQALYKTNKKQELESYKKFLEKFGLSKLTIKGYSLNLIKIERLQKAYMSAQNKMDEAIIHKDVENRSESLKSGKNEVISIEVGTQKPQMQIESCILSKKSPVDMDSLKSDLEKDMKEILNNKDYKL